MVMAAATISAAVALPRSSAAAGARMATTGKGSRVRTVFVPSANNPLVALRLYFRLGAADDPSGKEGLANLTADIMGQGGTKKRTYAEVLDAL